MQSEQLLRSPRTPGKRLLRSTMQLMSMSSSENNKLYRSYVPIGCRSIQRMMRRRGLLIPSTSRKRRGVSQTSCFSRMIYIIIIITVGTCWCCYLFNPNNTLHVYAFPTKYCCLGPLEVFPSSKITTFKRRRWKYDTITTRIRLYERQQKQLPEFINFDDTINDKLFLEDSDAIIPSTTDGRDNNNVRQLGATNKDDVIETTSILDHNEAAISVEREKFMMLSLLWIIALISALDRVAMSVALVPMSTEFALTDTIKGSISSLFSLGYGLAILPAGILVANTSPKIVLACGIALWSLATALTPSMADLLTVSTITGVATLLTPLLIARACVGAGESLVLPTAQRFLTVWTSADEKGFAIALIFSGFKTGTIVAYLLSPFVMDTFGGWRALFYTYGGIGILIMILWLVFAKDAPSTISQPSLPESSNTSSNNDDISTTTSLMKSRQTTTITFATTEAAAQSIVDTADSTKSTWEQTMQIFRNAPWKEMVSSKGSWAILFAHSAKNWGLYNGLSWTPTFYAEQYNIGVRDSAVLSLLPSLAGVVGGFIAGFAVDSILRKIQTDNDGIIDDEIKTKIRKVFQGISLYGGAIALGTLALNIPDEAWVAQTYLTTAVGFLGFGGAGFEAGNQDKAGEKWAGLLYSVTSLPAVIFGTFGVWLTGRVLDITHQDWSYVFSITAGIYVVGATAFILLFDSKREFD